MKIKFANVHLKYIQFVPDHYCGIRTHGYATSYCFQSLFLHFPTLLQVISKAGGQISFPVVKNDPDISNSVAFTTGTKDAFPNTELIDFADPIE